MSFESYGLTRRQEEAARRLVVTIDKPIPRALKQVLPCIPSPVHAIKLSQAVIHDRNFDQNRTRRGKLYLDTQLVGSPGVLAWNLEKVINGNRKAQPRYVSIHPIVEDEALIEAAQTIQRVVHGSFGIDIVLASVPSTMSEAQCKRAYNGRNHAQAVGYHSELARECGINIISCAGVAAEAALDKGLTVIGDGARLPDDDWGHHKYVMTPLDMLKDGIHFVATGGGFVYEEGRGPILGIKKVLNNMARFRDPVSAVTARTDFDPI